MNFITSEAILYACIDFQLQTEIGKHAFRRFEVNEKHSDQSGPFSLS